MARETLLFGFLLLTLLFPVDITGPLLLGPEEKSWTRDLLIPAGQSMEISGFFRRNSGGIQVTGNLTVTSCCGLSSNDIVFRIIGLSNGQYFGRVVGALTFEYNTEGDDDYSLDFDNRWDADSSNPSYHNKTVNVSVREIAPSAYMSSLFPFLLLVLGVVGVVAIVSVIVLRRRDMKQKKRVRAAGSNA